MLGLPHLKPMYWIERRAFPMKTIVMLLICWWGITVSAQNSVKTFTSPGGLFRFQYAEALVQCIPRQSPSVPGKSDALESNQPVPDSCASQGAICGGPGSSGNVLACFAYPKKDFEDKPHFLAAAFFVSEIRSAKTQAECAAGSRDWNVISSKTQPTMINGVAFKEFEIEDNWAGGGQNGPVYRTVHGGRCYELGIQIAISRAEYDPGTVKEFTEEDRSEAVRRLTQALNSLVFLK